MLARAAPRRGGGELPSGSAGPAGPAGCAVLRAVLSEIDRAVVGAPRDETTRRALPGEPGPLPCGVPSYRVRLVVGMMHRGVEPERVLPAAMGAAGERIEGGGIHVVHGVPQLTVRFEAPDDVAAAAIGQAVIAVVDELVDVGGHRVTRRYGSRWFPMR